MILCCGISVYLFFDPVVPFCFMVLLMLLNISATGRYALKNSLVKLLAVIFLFSVVLHGFVNPNGKTPALFFGRPLHLPFFGTFTLEGVYFGATFGFRIGALMLAGLLYVSTTNPAEMVNGFSKLGLPYRFGFMILMSLQLIPISTREAGIILSAQRARGLVEKNIFDKIKGLIPLFIPLVVNSLERMETLSMSLESRAYGVNKHPTALFGVRFKRSDGLLCAIALAITLAAVLVRVRYGSLNWMGNLTGWKQLITGIG